MPGPVHTRVSAISLFMAAQPYLACPRGDTIIHYTDVGTGVNFRRGGAGLIERGSADHDDRDEKAGDSVRAVDRALDILRAFKPQDGALTASELLRRVDLSRPTLYRLLRTLQRRQFLIASGDP